MIETEGQPKDEANEAGKINPVQKEKANLSPFFKGFGLRVLAVLVAGLVAGGLIGHFAVPNGASCLAGLPAAGPDADDLKLKVQNYLNENIYGPQGAEASVVSLEPFDDEFYIVDFDVSAGGEVLGAMSAYVTKSGKSLSGQILSLDEPLDTGEPEENGSNIPKSDKPVVELFVMSYCPYGLQMEKAILPVMELLQGKAEISIKFCDYIMHNLPEIEENTRQYCIQKEQNELFIDYLGCFAQSGDSAACLESAGVDQAMLDSCTAAADQEFGIMGLYNDSSSWLSGVYPIYPVHTAENEMYGVGGSPTLIINGAEVSVDRSPEAVKQAVCSAFNVAPEECSQALSTAVASSGFGGGTGASSSGSC
ncbi:MAG: hypothetical protein JW744_05770 [Candidatus Diapherotrites archaeon]|uniref:Thioredoxin-like fold domain-containing protein n=1 Tax=Candidatus Iainarchaeum sp. TaxID=3101447 RepID=A0A938YZ05_9ARCH|nr:hypothetical protein [Candidatus Diapherotrites archaeon]